MTCRYVLFCFLVSFKIHAAPSGFEELTELRSSDIKLMLNGEDSLTLPGEISEQFFHFNVDVQGKLRDFLVEKNIKNDFVEELVVQMVNGANSSSLCKGRRESCGIDGRILDTPQFVIIPHLDTVRLFVPPMFMSVKNTKARYIKNIISDKAVIMHHNIHASSSKDDAHGYYQNDTVAGVGGGFIHGDFEFSDKIEGDMNVDAHELTWNYLKEKWETQAGYISKKNSDSWAASELLDAGDRMSSLRFSIGSTPKLELKNNDTAPRLYLSLPSSGYLKIEKEDGSPVIGRYTSAGQQSISYDELPRGISTLVIRVMSGDKEVYRDVRKIYNTENSALSSDGFDVSLAAGLIRLDDSIGYEKYTDSNLDNAGYVQAQLVAGVSPYLWLGASLLNTKDNHYLKLGSRFKPVSWLSLDSVVGLFSNGSRYNRVSGSLGALTLGWSQYRDNTLGDSDKLTLDHFFYRAGSYEYLSLNWSQELFNGVAYINYSSNISESVNHSGLYALTSEEEFKGENLAVGYSWQGWRGSTISGTISKQLSNKDTPLSFGLNISIPLSKLGNDFVSYSLSGDETNELYHDVTYEHQFEVAQSASLGMSLSGFDGYEDDNILNAGFNGSYYNEKWTGNASVYADTNNQYGGDVHIATTSVLSGGDWYHTNNRADSYLLVTNIGDQGLTLDNDGDKMPTRLSLLKNNVRVDSFIIDNDKASLSYPLESYNKYKAVLDDTASDYKNLGDDTVEGASLPGSVLSLQIDNREVRSYISSFSSIDGEVINYVKCVGAGCLNVEKIDEGIFQFEVGKGLPFQLKGNSTHRCYIPSLNSTRNSNLGNNFCLPQFEDDSGLKVAVGIDKNFYYYLGEFASLDELTSLINTLKDSEPNIEVVKKHLEGKTILFIKSPFYLTQEVRDSVIELSEYAMKDVESNNYVSN